MGRQKKNMPSKGMEDCPLKELNAMEVSKLSDIEFKIMIIKMLKELTDNYKELSENYNSMKKEIETILKNRSYYKGHMDKIKGEGRGGRGRWDWLGCGGGMGIKCRQL